jgi:guanylate kinase
MSLVEERNIDTQNENVFEKVITHMTELNLQSDNYKKPLLILGPSGVGKDTMIDKLKEKYPNVFFKFPSYTTRERRPNEKEGIDYFYISEKEFKELESQGKLFGVKEYNKNFYASNKSKLREFIDNGDKIIILNYNIETANSIQKEFDFNYVAILPPSEGELRNRLIKREDKPEDIKNRMEASIKEIRLIAEAKYIKFRFVNKEINISFSILENHIKKLYPQFFKT